MSHFEELTIYLVRVRVVAPQKVQPKKKLAHSIRRNAQEDEKRCFEYKGVRHQCKDCSNRRLERERVACVVISQKTQQKE